MNPKKTDILHFIENNNTTLDFSTTIRYALALSEEELIEAIEYTVSTSIVFDLLTDAGLYDLVLAANLSRRVRKYLQNVDMGYVEFAFNLRLAIKIFIGVFRGEYTEQKDQIIGNDEDPIFSFDLQNFLQKDHSETIADLNDDRLESEPDYPLADTTIGKNTDAEIIETILMWTKVFEAENLDFDELPTIKQNIDKINKKLDPYLHFEYRLAFFPQAMIQEICQSIDSALLCHVYTPIFKCIMHHFAVRYQLP